ncbi:MAG TPA: GTP-binding protein [Polyangiaceae bacterium]|jgi:G3E family GTPase|nr:GTP-binding protein [Polyangiaceae bacterium]
MGSASVTAIDVVVVGGGLGSGKTSLLLHVVSRAKGVRIALVVNDFGELNIDGALLAESNADVVELSNGCVCCATGGDLTAGLRKLLAASKQAPDVIVVELSGVADPHPVLRELASLSPTVVVRRVVSVIDLDVEPALATGDTLLLRRLASAGLVVLNKEDRAPPANVDGWERVVRSANPAAKQLRTSFGRVEPDDVLRGDAPLSVPGANAARALHAAHRSVTLRLPSGLRRAALETFLADECASAERAKGFVELVEGHFVVQGVRGAFTFTETPARADAPWNALVVIGTEIDVNRLRAAASALYTNVVHNPRAVSGECSSAALVE